jgi:hypothetical protein
LLTAAAAARRTNAQPILSPDQPMAVYFSQAQRDANAHVEGAVASQFAEVTIKGHAQKPCRRLQQRLGRAIAHPLEFSG